MEDHVPRHAQMGAWVLINDRWYYVSQLENDKRVGTIETMVAIAVSLEVEADELLGWIAQRVTAASSDN